MNEKLEKTKSDSQESGNRQPPLRCGIKVTWFISSAAGIIAVALTLLFSMKGYAAWSIFFAAIAAIIFALSNLWLRDRIVGPILGLDRTARHIACGSYGALAEKHADDEIGTLTDAINDMSAKIDESSRVQTDFISSVSHELRTPLTAITGWSETLLYDEAIQGDSRRGVEIISKESGRLTNMVEELLEFTRIRDGRFTLNLETMDICAEIEDVVFTYGTLLQQEDTKLVYSPPEKDIPSIPGDPRRFKQVILNILDNAAKYGRGGNIELSVSMDDKFIIVTVRDHGPGISANDLPHVKERFYKGNSRARGSGIGLSICDEIVTRHGGTLTIENAESEGAVVIVNLPVQLQNTKVQKDS